MSQLMHSRQVFENLRGCLAATGASYTVAPSASTAVAVAALFRPEFLVEIEPLALVQA
jgi:hypothetical protein